MQIFMLCLTLGIASVSVYSLLYLRTEFDPLRYTSTQSVASE